MYIRKEDINRDLLLGALDEMKFWGRIVFEHLKFHRQAVDPGNERAFRAIDRYEAQVEKFYNAYIFPVPKSTPNQTLFYLTEQTLNVVIPARNFKSFLNKEIAACRLLSLIDPDLAEHLIRETDYFIGQVRYSRGEPTPTRAVLGMPDGARRALTVPRRILPRLNSNMLFTSTVENIMFFSRIHGEHARHVTLVTRPKLQEDIRLQAEEFEKLMFDNIEKAEKVEDTGTGFDELVDDSLNLAIQFRDFSFTVNIALHECAVPTGRVNAWPLLADHIAREAQYFVDVMNRISGKSPTPPPDTPYYPYII
ncbi:MAG: DUF2935 domain-containing protein [Bacillota bacterium]|nr:DUF2935 domain-containing protein [Bacillota bacterium]MDD3297924.1 DUF2935 domain-containing protein [Bacillota bacterium]MDD3850582.1 DUF2935 domain-containing protein [Bacillota bacterium]MDD4707370.1 DUF2935 domain-containing protein [Bacillota bacterium]